MDTRISEGYDREGPIRCIFLCEFHPIAGPTIKHQFPEEFISKEIFDSISVYIIPKTQLQRCVITINALGHKIIGYPVRIESPDYERNAYFFNLCFVCDSYSQTVQYEPVVKKLAEHLTIMEQEGHFLSRGCTKLPTLLAHLLHDLNTYRKATIVEGDTVIHVKVLDIRRDPPPVNDHDVPVFVAAVGLPAPNIYSSPLKEEPSSSVGSSPKFEAPDLFSITSDTTNADWDLTTQQLLPYIDGFNHVAKIAAESRIDAGIVKSCLQNLVYYDVVRLLPVLKYSNMYRATPLLNRLFDDTELQLSCLQYCKMKIMNTANESSENLVDENAIKMSDILSILCSLQQGTTLRTLCTRQPQPHTVGVDVRRLIVFAVMHGLIKCLKSYPVHLKNTNVKPKTGIKKLFNGKLSIDEICCMGKVDLPTLETIIDEDPDVVIIIK